MGVPSPYRELPRVATAGRLGALPPPLVPKRHRVQTYLDSELAALVRQRAQEEERSESLIIKRLILLGLSAERKLRDGGLDAKC